MQYRTEAEKKGRVESSCVGGLLKRDISQPGHLDDSADEVQTASDEDIDSLVSGSVELPDDVDGMLYGGQDVNAVLRERRDERGPHGGEFMLCLEVREVSFGDCECGEILEQRRSALARSTRLRRTHRP